jgi:hypothetical protein
MAKFSDSPYSELPREITRLLDTPGEPLGLGHAAAVGRAKDGELLASLGYSQGNNRSIVRLLGVTD